VEGTLRDARILDEPNFQRQIDGWTRKIHDVQPRPDSSIGWCQLSLICHIFIVSIFLLRADSHKDRSRVCETTDIVRKKKGRAADTSKANMDTRTREDARHDKQYIIAI
jgi:hypothetical protein